MRALISPLAETYFAALAVEKVTKDSAPMLLVPSEVHVLVV
jgi:hypothetical protein